MSEEQIMVRCQSCGCGFVSTVSEQCSDDPPHTCTDCKRSEQYGEPRGAKINWYDYI